jgi:hypothetical protein
MGAGTIFFPCVVHKVVGSRLCSSYPHIPRSKTAADPALRAVQRYQRRTLGKLLAYRTAATARCRSGSHHQHRLQGRGWWRASVLSGRSRLALVGPVFALRSATPPMTSSATSCTRPRWASTSRRSADGTSGPSVFTRTPSTRTCGRSSPLGRPASACWMSTTAWEDLLVPHRDPSRPSRPRHPYKDQQRASGRGGAHGPGPGPRRAYAQPRTQPVNLCTDRPGEASPSGI